VLLRVGAGVVLEGAWSAEYEWAAATSGGGARTDATEKPASAEPAAAFPPLSPSILTAVAAVLALSSLNAGRVERCCFCCCCCLPCWVLFAFGLRGEGFWGVSFFPKNPNAPDLSRATTGGGGEHGAIEKTKQGLFLFRLTSIAEFSPPPSVATRRAYACCAAMSTDALNGCIASMAFGRC